MVVGAEVDVLRARAGWRSRTSAWEGRRRSDGSGKSDRSGGLSAMLLGVGAGVGGHRGDAVKGGEGGGVGGPVGMC